MSGLARLLRRTPPAAERCGTCRHFEGDAARIEAALPGIAVLSSAHASVCGDDGLCGAHGRFTSARGFCPAFAARDGNHPG